MDIDYFGFQRNPFSQNADPELFYKSVCHQETCDKLNAGLLRGDKLFLLTGDAGTGKTALLRMVGAQFETDAKVIALQHSTCRGLEYLLESICAELHLEVKYRSGRGVTRLLNRFIQGYRGKKAIIIMIDDAHLIDDDVLLEFLGLLGEWSNSAGLIQVVLAGLPLLETKYEHASSRSQKKLVSRCFRLTRLDAVDVKGYIKQRLMAIGYSGKPLFPDETIKRIVECTRGIPRLINTVCGSALYVAGIEKQAVVTPDLVTEAENQCLLENNPKSNVGAQDIAFPPVYREGAKKKVTYSDLKSMTSGNQTVRVYTSKPHSAKSGFAPLSFEELTPVTFVSKPGSVNHMKTNGWFGFFGTKKVVVLAGIGVSLIAVTVITIVTVVPKNNILPDIDSSSFQPLSSPIRDSTQVTELAAMEDKAANSVAKEKQRLAENAQIEGIAGGRGGPGDKKPSTYASQDDSAEGLKNRIAKLRDLAQQQMHDRLLTVPKDDNALQTYRKILKLSPGDESAQRGVEEIRRKYTNWARRAAQAKDWKRSHRYYTKALSIVPVDMGVLREYRKLVKKQRGYFHEKEDPWAVNIGANPRDRGAADDAK